MKAYSSYVQHGLSRTRTARSWYSMIRRCYWKTELNYPDYGGRGIRVCKRWFHSLEAFLEDMGPRPKGMSLDRIDTNVGYCKSNCRWATRKQQQRNRRNTTRLKYKGEIKCVAQLAEEHGIDQSYVHSRLAQGWSLHRALTFPVVRRTKRKPYKYKNKEIG